MVRTFSHWIGRSWETLQRPVDVSSLVVFRVAFYTIITWDIAGALLYSTLAAKYITPAFHFTYTGFGWVAPLPGVGIYVHVALMGIAALCLAMGLWYRYMAPLFFLLFTWHFLLDASYFQNHYYFATLIAGIMAFAPANRKLAVDNWRHPATKGQYTPFLWIFLLRFQMAIVYIYGGIAKINPDWLRASPAKFWLPRKTDFPLLGPFMGEPWMAWAISYGGLLLDLCIVPFLVWKKTRPVAFAFAVLFHLMNSQLFHIGIFPWVAIACTALFWDPDWPRKCKVPLWPRVPPVYAIPRDRLMRPPWRTITGIVVALFLGMQIVLPLRRVIYSSNVLWAEEGYRFAWHMMLRSKTRIKLTYRVTFPDSGKHRVINPRKYLYRRQWKRMRKQPDLILQFAHFLRDDFEKKGHENVVVTADSRVSLNGRPPQPLIDPTVDLSKVEYAYFRRNTWILPLRRDVAPANVRKRRGAHSRGFGQ